MLEDIRLFLAEHIVCQGSSFLISIIMLLGIAAVSVAVYYITKYILYGFDKIIRRSPTTWDDDLLNDKMMRAISQLSPALAVNWLIPGLFGENADSVRWLSSITSLYILWAFIRIFVILLSNLYQAFLHRPKLRGYAVKGIFQMFQVVFICIGVIIGLSIIIGKSPVVIITALGASAAVLMLVFQDMILGLVASIQLTANKLLERGDWIEDKANDVNGEVLEVTLLAVKVRNWDNSVTSIPPYSLLKGSFRNYQPMKESGGRRVQRAIYVDMNSVRFLNQAEIERLSESGFLAPGLDAVQAGHEVNLRLLRQYLLHYLTTNPEVNHTMTTMVRQLHPTNAGLPLEMYFFLNNTNWEQYEALAADIFDHIYAVVREFDISIFQTPAGNDIAALNKK